MYCMEIDDNSVTTGFSSVKSRVRLSFRAFPYVLKGLSAITILNPDCLIHVLVFQYLQTVTRAFVVEICVITTWGGFAEDIWKICKN